MKMVICLCTYALLYCVVQMFVLPAWPNCYTRGGLKKSNKQDENEAALGEGAVPVL